MLQPQRQVVDHKQRGYRRANAKKEGQTLTRSCLEAHPANTLRLAYIMAAISCRRSPKDYRGHTVEPSARRRSSVFPDVYERQTGKPKGASTAPAATWLTSPHCQYYQDIHPKSLLCMHIDWITGHLYRLRPMALAATSVSTKVSRNPRRCALAIAERLDVNIFHTSPPPFACSQPARRAEKL